MNGVVTGSYRAWLNHFLQHMKKYSFFGKKDVESLKNKKIREIVKSIG